MSLSQPLLACHAFVPRFISEIWAAPSLPDSLGYPAHPTPSLVSFCDPSREHALRRSAPRLHGQGGGISKDWAPKSVNSGVQPECTSATLAVLPLVQCGRCRTPVNRCMRAKPGVLRCEALSTYIKRGMLAPSPHPCPPPSTSPSPAALARRTSTPASHALQALQHRREVRQRHPRIAAILVVIFAGGPRSPTAWCSGAWPHPVALWLPGAFPGLERGITGSSSGGGVAARVAGAREAMTGVADGGPTVAEATPQAVPADMTPTLEMRPRLHLRPRRLTAGRHWSYAESRNRVVAPRRHKSSRRPRRRDARLGTAAVRSGLAAAGTGHAEGARARCALRRRVCARSGALPSHVRRACLLAARASYTRARVPGVSKVRLASENSMDASTLR